MGNNIVIEKGALAVAGAIDNLVGDNKVPGRQFFPETAAGIDGDDRVNAQRLEGKDISAGRNPGRIVAVTAAMTRQEGNRDAAKFTNDNGVARLTERRVKLQFLDFLKAVNLVKAAAADDGYPGLRHYLSSMSR
jgi:hypothetical protein